MTLLLQLPTSVPQMEVTEALANALTEASKLPTEDQDFLASLIMEEIRDEKKWTDSFAGSQDMLSELAAQARAEIERGETISLEDFLAETSDEPCKD